MNKTYLLFLLCLVTPAMLRAEVKPHALFSDGAVLQRGCVVPVYGNATDIHPQPKEPVGARLALAARAVAYGEHIEYSGPVFRGMKVLGDKATLSFTHVGGGLVAKGGALKGFIIAGSDNNFVPAEAVIDGKTVIVSSKEVTHPVAVRYGWANVPDMNWFNTDGLPATPFRTDSW